MFTAKIETKKKFLQFFLFFYVLSTLPLMLITFFNGWLLHKLNSKLTEYDKLQEEGYI